MGEVKRIGHKEKLNGCAVATEALAVTIGQLGPGGPLALPCLEARGLGLPLEHQPLDIVFPQGGVSPSAKWLSLAKGIPRE